MKRPLSARRPSRGSSIDSSAFVRRLPLIALTLTTVLAALPLRAEAPLTSPRPRARPVAPVMMVPSLARLPEAGADSLAAEVLSVLGKASGPEAVASVAERVRPRARPDLRPLP